MNCPGCRDRCTHAALAEESLTQAAVQGRVDSVLELMPGSPNAACVIPPSIVPVH